MHRPLDLDLIPITSHISTNAAGLRWLAALKPDPHAAVRCVRGTPWLCPYAKAHLPFVCLTGPRSEIVKIGYRNYTETYEPIGQMSLFAPTVTQRRVRRHWKTGVELPSDSLPVLNSLFCRKLAITYIRWLEREGFHPPSWRIEPLGRSTRAYRRWTDEQIEHRHLKPCVFGDF